MLLDIVVKLFILTGLIKSTNPSVKESKSAVEFDGENIVSQWPVWNRWPVRTVATNETFDVTEVYISEDHIGSDKSSHADNFPLNPPTCDVNQTNKCDHFEKVNILANQSSEGDSLIYDHSNTSLTAKGSSNGGAEVAVARIPLNQSRIVGGNSAEIGQYPFMAQIVTLKKNGRGVFCGGTLISHYHILTAGHCVTLPCGLIAKPKTVQVRLGATNLSDGGELCLVSKIHRHPKYQPLSSRMNGASIYDMAVLKLKHTVKFTDCISPVTLATSSDTDKLVKMAYMNWPCKVLGWGWTKPGIKLDSPGPENTLSKHLMATTVHLVDWTECRTIVPILETKSELCCSSPHATSGCKGDSGGPLVCEDNKEYGLVSRGTGAGCGIPNLPYIYTRVDTLYKFIEQAMKSH